MKATRMAAAALLIAVLAFAAGCANVNVKLALHADGSADWGLVALADENADMAQIWQEAALELREQGCEVTEKSENGFSGIRVSRHYDDAGALASSGFFSGDNPAFSVRVQKGLFATAYEVRATVDPAKAPPLMAMPSGVAGRLLEQTELTLDITLPVKASRHNAASVSADGRTYTWKLSPAGPNVLELSASSPRWANILWAAGCAALVILIILLVVRAAGATNKRSRMRRR